MTAAAKKAKAIEAMFEKLHQNPPEPFNPSFRPGFGDALSQHYHIWCQGHEDSTQEERKLAYATLADKLAKIYPTIAEIKAKNGSLE